MATKSSSKKTSSSSKTSSTSSAKTQQQRNAAIRQSQIESKAGMKSNISGRLRGSKPGVLTQSGNTIFKNGKLVGNYNNSAAAANAMSRLTGSGRNIKGDKSGSTYRYVNKYGYSANDPSSLTSDPMSKKKSLNSPIASLTSPASSAISSTDALRAERAGIRGEADYLSSAISENPYGQGLSASDMDTSSLDALTSSVLNAKSFGQTEEGQNMFSKLMDSYNRATSGELSDDEKEKLDEEEANTRAEYEAVAQQAIQQRNAGMASATVAAGQKGGLMNSQYSGIAAEQSTAGQSFVGAGGELYRIQSEYDYQISQIRIQGIKAADEARNAAEEAIRSGRKEDLEMAQSLFDQMKSMYNEELELSFKKQDEMQEYQKSLLELQKYQRESASTTISALAASGKSADELPDWYFEDLDAQSGYAEGTSRGLFDIAQREQEREDATADIEQATKLNSLLMSLPVGESITVGDTTYQSLNKGEKSVYSEDDGEGNLTVYSVNQDTGEVSVLKKLTGISATDGWQTQELANGQIVSVNARTGQVRSIWNNTYGNIDAATVQNLQQNFFPEGETPAGTEHGWCGEFVREFTGYEGASISSKEAKKALYEQYGWAVNPDGTMEGTPQYGDAFIMDSVGSYGHVGIVLSADQLPDGSYDLSIVDSNWGENGKTRYTTINSKEIDGIARMGINSKYDFGTDGSTGTELYSEDKTDIYGTSEMGRNKDTKYLADVDKIVGNVQQNAAVKNFPTQRSAYLTAESVPEADSNAQQQISLVYAYMKLLDPDSVVREGEFATAQKYDSLLSSLGVRFNNLAKGKVVSDEVIKNIKNEVERIYGQSEEAYSSALDQYVEQAKGLGIDASDITAGYYQPKTSSSLESYDEIKAQYPEYSSQIESAIESGYSVEEILSYLANIK